VPLKTTTGKASGESVLPETATGKVAGESMPSETATGKASGESVSPKITTGKVLEKSVPPKTATGTSGSKSALKQQRVYLRKECSSPKITKSWVAKRCAWNDGRGDSSPLGLLGKSLFVCVTNLNLGGSEGRGVPGETEDQEGGNLRAEAHFSQTEPEGMPEDT
jgi:hypothetical protein